MCSNINTCPFSICKPPFQGTHPTRVIFSLSVQPPSVYMTCHCMRPVSAGSHNQTNHLEGHMHANPFSHFQASLRETHIHSQSCSYISPPTPRDTFKNFPTQYLQCYGRQPFGGFSPGGMTLGRKKGLLLAASQTDVSILPFLHQQEGAALQRCLGEITLNYATLFKDQVSSPFQHCVAVFTS